MVFYHPFSIRFYNLFMLYIEHIEEKFPGFLTVRIDPAVQKERSSFGKTSD